jgi:hypothetical protein
MSAEVTKLVHHAQPSAQEKACQEILGKCEPNVGGAPSNKYSVTK